MNKLLENNQVTINGRIISDFSYSHEKSGEKFYIVYVEIQRKSGIFDVLPVMVSNRLMDTKQNYVGCIVNILGQYRSYNRHTDEKTHLILSVFALEVEFCDYLSESYENNKVLLCGVICKNPVYRTTPLGREIADVLIAVNRSYGKSDYIPCICWGRSAIFSDKLTVGTKIELVGRIQSRNYKKILPDGSEIIKTAYEVSVSKMQVQDE